MGDRWDKDYFDDFNDINASFSASGGTGIKAGSWVGNLLSPGSGLQVTVANFSILEDNSATSVTGTNVNLTTAPSTSGYARYDLIVYDLDTSLITLQTGTPLSKTPSTNGAFQHTSPVPEALTNRQIYLGKVYVDTNATSLTQDDIFINQYAILEVVETSGNQTVAGVKTFSSFPVTPSSAPTSDYQVPNKKYVDDQVIATNTFDLLSDTPASKTGESLKLVRVNVGETALEYVAGSSLTFTASQISDFDTEVSNNTDVAANTVHKTSDGTDHSNVVLNDTHRASNGTDHANVVLNDTHRASNGTDHANVVLNDTHRASAGTDHSDVVLNNTHRTDVDAITGIVKGDGAGNYSAVTDNSTNWNTAYTHSQVVTGNPHSVTAVQISDFDTEVSNNTDVAANTTHRSSAGTDHSDVVLNNTHRSSDGTDHTYIDQDIRTTASPQFVQVTVGNTGLVVGTSTPFSDATGTLTLQNIDVIDATTEATIESAIDTLPNLTSIQSQTVTFSGSLNVEAASNINQDVTSDAKPTFAGQVITSTDTTSDAVSITASSLTTGKGLSLYSNSADTGTRYLIDIHNDNAAASGARLLRLTQDSNITACRIDHNGTTGRSLWTENSGEGNFIHRYTGTGIAGGKYFQYDATAALTSGDGLFFARMNNSGSTIPMAVYQNFGTGNTFTSDHNGSTGYAVRIESASTDDDISVDSGAKLTAAGVWTDAPSYRKYKDPIEKDLDVLNLLDKLDVDFWKYKDEEIDGSNRFMYDQNIHCSPYLDDWFNKTGLGDISGVIKMDYIGILFKICKEQQKLIKELQNASITT